MAGSASNWFKPTSGPLKGQAVYLSRKQQGAALTKRQRGQPVADRRRSIVALLERSRLAAEEREGRAMIALIQGANAHRPVGAACAATAISAAAAGRIVAGLVGRPVVRDDDHPRLGDAVLAGIVAERGFDARPKVVGTEELDRLIQGGAEELFRGVGAGKYFEPARGGWVANRVASGEELVEEFRSGLFYQGRGIYGNGTYFAGATPGGSRRDVALRTAQHFADTGGTGVGDGATVRAVLATTARTISYHALRAAMPGWRRALEAAAATPRERRTLNQHLKAIGHDPGRWAALLGYDAFTIGAGHESSSLTSRSDAGDGGGPSQTVVLNRGALIVEDRATRVADGSASSARIDAPTTPTPDSRASASPTKRATGGWVRAGGATTKGARVMLRPLDLPS